MNKPARRFRDTILRLDVLFRKALRIRNHKQRELYLSAIIVKLHDQWNYRSRQVIFESFAGSECKMMRRLRQNWGRKKMGNTWEPDWHVTSDTIRAARILNVGNYSQIQSVFGAVMYCDDLRWTRNAIVHNIPCSFIKYRDMALTKYRLSNIFPFEIILYTNPNTGNSIYEDWCDEMVIALQNIF